MSGGIFGLVGVGIGLSMGLGFAAWRRVHAPPVQHQVTSAPAQQSPAAQGQPPATGAPAQQSPAAQGQLPVAATQTLDVSGHAAAIASLDGLLGQASPQRLLSPDGGASKGTNTGIVPRALTAQQPPVAEGPLEEVDAETPDVSGNAATLASLDSLLGQGRAQRLSRFGAGASNGTNTGIVPPARPAPIGVWAGPATS